MSEDDVTEEVMPRDVSGSDDDDDDDGASSHSSIGSDHEAQTSRHGVNKVVIVRESFVDEEFDWTMYRLLLRLGLR